MPSTAPHFAQALGHEAADKRLDILRRIGEAGSISEAARGAGVSYKAAWQALETLSNLAGTALIDKAVGGTGGGGARLTAAGEQLLEAAARLDDARAAVLARLPARPAAQRPSPGAAGLGLRTSMRNHLPGRVAAIRRSGGSVRVTLDLPDGAAIGSRVTVESVELLGLRPGLPVLALCKATAVTVAATVDRRPGLNVLAGEVTRLPRAGRAGEVSLRLSSGLQLVGFADDGHGLRAGRVAEAALDEAAVVIALPV